MGKKLAVGKGIRRMAFGIVVFFVLLLWNSGCLTEPKTLPQELSFQGLVLTLWDCMEPSFPGIRLYQDRVKSVVDDFSEKHQVKVEVTFMERREILSFLLGERDESQPPCLTYSTEWPTVPYGAQDLTGVLAAEEYLDGAAHYWTLDGKIMGVPSYVHWVGMAVRPSALPISGIPADSGYWPESQWFLPSAIEVPGSDFTPQSAVSYLEWLKSSSRGGLGDPLNAWNLGAVSALFPVTPHLYKWLRASYGDEVSLSPIPGPFGKPRFHCTVPGYVVLSEEEPYRSCALLLAKELAANRGVWAARSIGGVPAAIQDMLIYDLEAGIPGHDKSILRGIDQEIASAALIAGEGIRRQQISQGVGQIVPQFIEGDVTLQDLEKSIRDLWESHTTP